jgi:hypothetical protein
MKRELKGTKKTMDEKELKGASCSEGDGVKRNESGMKKLNKTKGN